jgi:hypothetical protein
MRGSAKESGDPSPQNRRAGGPGAGVVDAHTFLASPKKSFHREHGVSQRYLIPALEHFLCVPLFPLW